MSTSSSRATAPATHAAVTPVAGGPFAPVAAVANLAAVFPDWNEAAQGYHTIVHAHTGVPSGNGVWIDSTANYHLGKDRSWFFNYRVLLTPEPITGIAGSASVIGVGDIAFLAKLSGDQTSRVVFTNVLHAPGIVTNLLRISRHSAHPPFPFFLTDSELTLQC